MGFIERLEQEQVEAGARVQELIQRQQQQMAEKLRAEAVERKRHEQRKQQAKNYREESGVAVLVKRLDVVLNGDNPEPRSFEIMLTPLSVTARDPDSIFDRVVWNCRDTRRMEITAAGVLSHYEARSIVVESQPTGNIVIHGVDYTEVPVQDWKNDKSVLESALEKSYRNPGLLHYTKLYAREEGWKPKLPPYWSGGPIHKLVNG